MHKHTGYVLNAEVGMPCGVAELDKDAKLAPNIIPSTIYQQTNSSNVWTIAHNLNRFPSVIVVDSAGSKVEGDIDYIDANNVRVTFGNAFAGTVYLS